MVGKGRPVFGETNAPRQYSQAGKILETKAS